MIITEYGGAGGYYSMEKENKVNLSDVCSYLKKWSFFSKMEIVRQHSLKIMNPVFQLAFVGSLGHNTYQKRIGKIKLSWITKGNFIEE